MEATNSTSELDTPASPGVIFFDLPTVIMFNTISFGVICPLIVLFGITTNIINIICFLKQGFTDQINISLLGMAISDLASLVTLIWNNIALCPPFFNLDLHFNPIETQYATAAMPHTVFTRITACITAFITLERCLCIALPLKIKQIITNKRVVATVACIFAVMIIGQAPYYAYNKLDWKFFPDINKTLIGLVVTEESDVVENISYFVNNVFVNFMAFVITIFCTMTIAIQLHKQAKWRMKSSNTDRLSNQNKTVAKLVIMVSMIFISCFTPLCIVFIIMPIYPEYSIKGKYKDVILLFGGIGIILESVNSSVNIFVYYRMSTKYRETFRKLFNRI